jgi:CO/xanthine dehydrogenase FAD-binding subunit
VDVFLPGTLEDALEILAAHPGAVPIAGGTDVMVGINFRRIRPPALVDLTRLGELQVIDRSDDRVFLGGGVTYARILGELADVTTLAQASRTVGSPQIRTRGTVGGNLGTGSPAGDALPVLAVHEAEVGLVAAGGRERWVRWDEFLQGPKRTARRDDELIVGVRWRPVAGPGSFSKVGTRNAMVIAVASVCLLLDPETRSVRLALGSVAPTVIRAPAAEAFAGEALTAAGAWDRPSAGIDDAVAREFGALAAAATSPIDDVRGTAEYRRHAVAVLAARALRWATSAREEAA